MGKSQQPRESQGARAPCNVTSPSACGRHVHEKILATRSREPRHRRAVFPFTPFNRTILCRDGGGGGCTRRASITLGVGVSRSITPRTPLTSYSSSSWMLSTKRHAGRLASSDLPPSRGNRRGQGGTAEALAAAAAVARAVEALAPAAAAAAPAAGEAGARKAGVLGGEDLGLDIHSHLSSLVRGERGARKKQEMELSPMLAGITLLDVRFQAVTGLHGLSCGIDGGNVAPNSSGLHIQTPFLTKVTEIQAGGFRRWSQDHRLNNEPGGMKTPRIARTIDATQLPNRSEYSSTAHSGGTFRRKKKGTKSVEMGKSGRRVR